MNPKSMLRRTLAMLLVLIFALSNMGLAEMADAIADGIPAEAPQIEEIAGEAAPVAEQAEEAAPAEEQAAAAEEAPVEDEASEEAEAPAQEAPVVTVEAYAIDEQSIFADAAAEGYDGEIAYQWEVADGEEWIAIEGATDATYASDMAEMAGQTYRCVVTAGETTAASEGVVSDPSIFGVEAEVDAGEPIMLGTDNIELASVNDTSAPLTLVVTVGGNELTKDAPANAEVKDGYYVVVDETVNIRIEGWSASTSEDWKKQEDDDAHNKLSAEIRDSTIDGKLTDGIKITNQDNVSSEDDPKCLTVSVTTAGATEGTGSVKLYVLPKLTGTPPKGATMTLTAESDPDNSEVHKNEDDGSYDILKQSRFTATVSGTKYPVAGIGVYTSEDLGTHANSVFTPLRNTGTFTENDAADGTPYYVAAKFRGDSDNSAALKTKIVVKSKPNAITSTCKNGELHEWVENDSTTGKPVKLTLGSSNEAVWMHGITGVEWDITKSEGEAVTEAAAPFKFEQGDDIASWNVKLKDDAEMPIVVTEYTVKPSTTGDEAADSTGFTVKVYPNPSETALKTMVTLEGDGVKQTAAKDGYEIRQNEADGGGTNVTVTTTGDYADFIKLSLKKTGAGAEGADEEVTGDTGVWIDATNLNGDESDSFSVKELAAGPKSANQVKAKDGEAFKLIATLDGSADPAIAAEIPFVIQPAATGVTLTVKGQAPGGTEDVELGGADNKETTVAVPLKLTYTVTGPEGVNAWNNGVTINVYNKKATGGGGDYSEKNDVAYDENEDGTITFKDGGEYGVTVELDGYTGKTSNRVDFTVYDLLKKTDLKFIDNTTSAVLVGPNATGKVELATATPENTFTNYTWEITNNKWGNNPPTSYVDVVQTKADSSSSDYSDDKTTAGKIGLELQVNKAIIEGTPEDTPVLVTVSTTGLVTTADGRTEKGTISAEFELTVVPAATNLTDSDIDFPDVIPIPNATTGTKNPSAANENDPWNQFTTLKLVKGKENYPVTWSIITERDINDPKQDKSASENKTKFVEITNADTGALKLNAWGEANAFTAADANGVKVTFRAAVQTDSTADAKTVYLYKTVTLKPEPAKIVLQMKEGSSKATSPKAVDVAAGTVDLYARKGRSLEFTAQIKGPEVTDDTDPDNPKEIKPFGSLSGLTWDIKKASTVENESSVYTEPDAGDITHDATNNSYKFNTDAVTSYQLQITNETGMTLAAKPIIVHVQQEIKSVEIKIDGDAARTSVYEDKAAEFSLNITAEDGKVYDTAETDPNTIAALNDIYTQDLTWTFPSNMVDGIVLSSDGTDGNKINSTNEGTTTLYVPRGTTKFWMKVPNTLNYASSNKSISVTAGDYALNNNGVHNTTAESGTSDSVTVRVYADAASVKPFDSGNVLKFETDADTGIGAVAQNSTLQVTLDSTVAKKLTDNHLTYKFTLSGVKNEDGEGADVAIKANEIDSWATIDSKGLITVKPLAAGDNPKNEIDGNSDYAKLTVMIAVDGYESVEDFYKTADFYVYREPVDVEVKQGVLDSEVAKDADLPKAARVGNILYIRALPVGPTIKVGGTDSQKPSVGDVKLSVRNASGTPLSSTTLTLVKPDDTDDKYAGYYKMQLKANGTGGTVEITATYGKLTKTYSLSVLNETIVSASGATTCSSNDDGPHNWVLNTTQNNPKGHTYTCSYCNDVSEPVAHAAQFVLVDTGSHANDPDFDPYVISANRENANGVKFVCPVCEYECKHEQYESKNTTAKRLDGTNYHTAVCPTCGQTLKQEHKDNHSGICSVCGDTSAMPKFGGDGKTMQVIVGDTATPDLSIENAQSWSAEFTTDDPHITVVDPATGEIKGVSLFDASDAKQTATLNAKVTIYTIDSTTNKPVGQDINTSIEVEVLAHPTTIQVEAERDFVIEADSDDTKAPADVATAAGQANTVTANTLLKLTAKPDVEVEKAVLKDYEWQLYTEEFTDATTNKLEQAQKHSDIASHFKFYYVDADGKLVNVTKLDEPEIWVAVDEKNPLDSKYNGHLFATYTLPTTAAPATPGATTVTPATVTPAKFDVLKSYETLDIQVGGSNGALAGFLELDKTQVVQDDTITILEDAYDSRYGEITYSIKVTDNTTNWGGSVTQTELNKWATVSGKTVTVKPAGVGNVLAAGATKKITITAEIPGTPKSDGTPDTPKASAKLTFAVVDKTAAKTIKLQYSKTKDDNWADIPADLTVMPEDELYLKVLVLGEDGKPLQNAGGATPVFDWKNFAWTKPDAAVAKVVDANDPANGEYKVTFQNVSASTEAKFTATSGAGSASATITVKPLISKITLSADSNMLVPDEKVTVAGEGTISKDFTFTYTVEPADATDTLKWHIYDAADTEKAVDLQAEPGAVYDLQKVEGATNTMKVIARDMNTTRDLIICAEPSKLATVFNEQGQPEKDENNNDKKVQVSSNELAVTAYKLASDGADALIFTIDGSNADVHMSVDETKTIDKHEYNIAEGYNSTIPLGDIVVENVEGTDVVAVDQQNFTVTAKNPGTATLKLRTYYWTDTDASTHSAEKTITVIVEAAADSLEFADTVKVEEGYDLTVGKRPYEAIAATDITPKRTVEGSETGEKETVQSATVELVSDEPAIVKVNKTENGWELEPVAKGETTVTAKVGAAVSQSIPVRVKAAPTGIKFFVDGEEVVGTEKQLAKDSAAVTITWALDPEDADAEYYPLTVTKGGEAVTDASISFTPDAVGTTTIEAQTNNKDYVSGDDSVTNQKYLKAHLDLIVTEEGGDKPIKPPTPSENSVKFIDAGAIGPNETTRVYVTGIADGETVAWSTEPASGVISVEADANDQTVATVKYEAIGDGKATVIATITGTAGERTAETDVYLLTPVEGIVLMHGESELTTLTMGKSETIEVYVEPTGGREYKTPELEEEAGEAGISYSHYPATSITSSNEKLVTVTGSDPFVITAKAQPGKKDAAPQLTVSMDGVEKSLTVPVTITTANKSFNIGAINGSTLYMKPGESKQIEIKTNPSKSFVNLICSATVEGDEEGDYYGDLIFTQADKVLTVKVDESVAAGKIYNVSVTADGYANHADQGFTVVVVDEAAEGDEPKLAVRKVGVVGTGYAEDEESGMTTAVGSVTVVKSEQLQAYFIDKEGSTVSGTVTWDKLTKAQQKKVTISETGLIKAKGTGSVTITGHINGMTSSITINVKAAPKYALEPNETTRKVAVGEEFKLGLTSTNGYPDANATIWYTIDSTNDLGFASVEGEDKDGTYTFEKPGTTTLTLKPVWGGKAKTVKFTVVEPLATDFDVPETATVAPKGNTIIRANLVDGYANLTWRVGETADSPEITTAKKKVAGVSGVQVQKLANDEIQITTNKASEGTVIKLLVQSAENTEGKQIEVTVKAADAGFPTGTEVVFDKPVITVGESTTVSVKYADDVETLPTGTIKYSYVKSEGKVSISKGNVVKASKPGLVTVSAKLGSGAPIQGQLFVLPKASIVTSLKPTTMYSGESVTMDVTLKNYELDNTQKPVPATPEYLREGFSTVGVLSAESNSSLINVELSQDPDTDTPNVYQLKLTATDAVKSANGKYTSATITLKLTNNAKKTFKIQVVDGQNVAGQYEMQMPKSITVAKGMSVTLTPAVPAGKTAPNLNWRFASEEDAAAAKTHFLTISDGKVTTDKTNSTPTSPDEPIVIEAIQAEEDVVFSVDVNIVDTKVKKNGFSIVVPNRTLHAGENILATVKYDSGSGAGDVTWKSNHTDVIAVDKKSGMLTIKGKTAKYSTAKITATANGKKATLDLTPADAVKTIEFTQDVLAIDPTKVQTVKLADYVKVDGEKLGSAETYEGFVSFAIVGGDDVASIDPATGELTLAIAPEGETLNGTIIVEAYTYNDKSASMAVEIGEGSESGEVTPPTPPVKEQILESVDLWVGGYELTTDAENPIELAEEDTFNPSIRVKDTDGLQIVEGYTAEWTVVEEGMADKVQLDTATGALVAKKSTKNEADGTDSPMTIKVTVTKGEKTAEATYYLKINPKFGPEHFVFTPAKTSLVEDETTTATFKFDSKDYDSYLLEDNVTITSKTPDAITVDRDSVNDTATEFAYKIVAKKSGTATIEIEVTVDGKKYTKSENFEIIAKPESDLLSIEGIDAAAGLTLAEGEVQEFAAVLDASFTGTQTAEDFTFSFEDGDGKKIEDGDSISKSPITIVKKPVASSDSEEYETGKFIITATDDINQAGLTNPITVVVKAYDKAEQRFTVKVEDAPTVSIEATPETFTNEAPSVNAYAGAGESVTLTVKQKKDAAADSTNAADHYYKGVELRIIEPAEVPEGEELTLVPGEGDSATLTYSGTGNVVVGVFHKGDTDENAIQIENTTFTVTFQPVPTGTESIGAITVVQTMLESASSLVDKEVNADDSGVYTIGVDEKITASFDFVGGAYSKEITWKEDTGKVSLDWLTDDDNGNFTTCEITGVSPTSAGATLTVSAYYNKNVYLGSIKLKVVGKATEINLVQAKVGATDGATVPFDFQVPTDGKTVYAAFNEGAQIDCDLISSNKDVISVERVSRTKWTLKVESNGNPGDTVTLTLKSSTGMVKRYIARIQ